MLEPSEKDGYGVQPAARYAHDRVSLSYFEIHFSDKHTAHGICAPIESKLKGSSIDKLIQANHVLISAGRRRNKLSGAALKLCLICDALSQRINFSLAYRVSFSTLRHLHVIYCAAKEQASGEITSASRSCSLITHGQGRRSAPINSR